MRCDNSNRRLSRSIVESALAIYLENGLSIKYPVQCLDLSLKEEEGLKWIKNHSTSICVVPQGITSNQNDPTSDKTTKENDESKYVLIEKNDFNFIYVECTTEGSSYFDCVFRKIARNGLFALSTSDDPALYGRPPDPALRCYGGHIVRTFYAPELAVRLILAAMARSAARFSKSIEVLLSVAIKSSITILVKVKKGAESAVKCLSSVKTLAHCSICEERVFLSNNDGYVFDNVKGCLSCGCAEMSEGRTVQALGPLWAAALGSPFFPTCNRAAIILLVIALSALARAAEEHKHQKKQAEPDKKTEKRGATSYAHVSLATGPHHAHDELGVATYGHAVSTVAPAYEKGFLPSPTLGYDKGYGVGGYDKGLSSGYVKGLAPGYGTNKGYSIAAGPGYGTNKGYELGPGFGTNKGYELGPGFGTNKGYGQPALIPVALVPVYSHGYGGHGYGGHGFGVQGLGGYGGYGYGKGEPIKTITYTKEVPVPVPHLYPVTIEKKIPYPVKVPVAVPVERPVPVHVYKPVPLAVERPVPYPVERPVPYPVKVPVKVPVAQPLPYPVPTPVPYPVYIKSTHQPHYDESGSAEHYAGNKY